MPTRTYTAGTIGQPHEVGPGTRVVLTGTGYVEYTTSPLATVISAPSQVTWTTWPAGQVAGTFDTVQRCVIRAQATGACTLTWEEGYNARPVQDTQVWQESQSVYDPSTGAPLGADGTKIGGAVAARSIVADPILFLFDFTSRADGAVNGAAADYGPSIAVTGAGSFNISGGSAIPASTSTAYAYTTVTQNLGEVGVEFTHQGASPGTAIAFGAMPSLAVNSAHLNIYTNGYTLMAYTLGGLEEIIAADAWDDVMLSDGTVYRVRMALDGDCVVIRGPFGEVFTHRDPRVLALAGKTAFFEGQTQGGAYTKIRRFWGTGRNVSSSSTYASLSEPTASSGIEGGSKGRFNPRTVWELMAGRAPVAGAQLYFGPEQIVAHNLAAITAGAGSFQCDQWLPAGTYAIDGTSASGANREVITVASSSGTSSPFTVTLTGTFTKNHAAHSAGAPVAVVSTGTPPRKSIWSDNNGWLWLDDLTGANNRFMVGNYSCTLQKQANNILQLYDYAIGNPTHFGVSGGFRMSEGANKWLGVATLVGGTVTVSNTRVTATSRILLASQVDGGTPGWLRVSARNAGTSFTITSSSASDTSQVAWAILEPL